ncbi:hypothetical protein GCM10011572_37170 [Pseudoduganella buxea]|uniref:Uncharacterized protein n=1 Tax=Pseudoduganella buxea TaxID=1949069 RepID=A0ABQ1KVD5_9BURK|nr:hypothetical protein GCM10011572_37170 [Pseudoduganella buxea]
MPVCSTETLIEELVEASCGDSQDPRAGHALRQALYGLVRLARSEQLTAMRQDTRRALGRLRPADLARALTGETCSHCGPEAAGDWRS